MRMPEEGQLAIPAELVDDKKDLIPGISGQCLRQLGQGAGAQLSHGPEDV